MPGGRLRSYRLGDRAELLVEQLLAALAFTTPVPRQEDIGVDFFCSLISQEERLLKAGPFFSVQSKSSTVPIVYEKSYELEWIENQENPLFICVADRDNLAMDVYSTWNLLCGILGGWRGQKRPTRISLMPGAQQYPWPGVENAEDGSQEIRLGKPILRVTVTDMFNDDRIEQITAVMQEWVKLDRTNIMNRHADINWVLGPLQYETGEMPYASGRGAAQFHFHPANLNKVISNLGRVATALTLIERNSQDVKQPAWVERISTLEAVLRSHWDLFDEPVRRVLVDHGVQPQG
jgi:hypothetical protein